MGLKLLNYGLLLGAKRKASARPAVPLAGAQARPCWRSSAVMWSGVQPSSWAIAAGSCKVK